MKGYAASSPGEIYAIKVAEVKKSKGKRRKKEVDPASLVHWEHCVYTSILNNHPGIPKIPFRGYASTETHWYGDPIRLISVFINTIIVPSQCNCWGNLWKPSFKNAKVQ